MRVVAVAVVRPQVVLVVLVEVVLVVE